MEYNKKMPSMQINAQDFHKKCILPILNSQPPDTKRPAERTESLQNRPRRPATKFLCSFPNCVKLFNTLTAKDKHLRYHYKERSYYCHLCPKSYTQSNNLVKHMRKHRTPAIELRRIHNCEFCSKSYTEKYNLKIHERKAHPIEYERKYNIRSGIS
ncbi:unnamed protein product [Moneuplotes crassus]|uniref:C2H2-type domain-containing protein n=1 Tax=Euplotes crassus TaxID=5936 RepID=A0AAD1XWS8_EUPCR|nr:unnamed protein product [Moneuplotes crassus]